MGVVPRAVPNLDTTSKNSSAQKVKHKKTGGKGGRKTRGQKKGSKNKGDCKGEITGSDIMQDLAGGIGAEIALAMLLGPELTFSDKANALYALSYMCSLLMSVCCRDDNESSVSTQHERSKRIRGAPNLPVGSGPMTSYTV